MSLKKIILSHKILYELYFFLSGKKINRTVLDKKIARLTEKTPAHKDFVPDLIVSLTSYGERLSDLKYTLLSLVLQSVRSEKIIVWLGEGEVVPDSLRMFERYGVAFVFCKDTRSYTKLIPALQSPVLCKKHIVTADDDIFYEKDWLKRLWQAHLRYPNDKIAHIANIVSFNSDGILLPYNKWSHNVRTAACGKMYFPTGVGGILYPSVSVSASFLDENLYMKLAPNADDVWFYFMGILSGQNTRIVKHPCNRLKYVDIYKEYGLNGKSTLQSVNVEQNQNDMQIRAVMEHFNIFDKRLHEIIYE